MTENNQRPDANTGTKPSDQNAVRQPAEPHWAVRAVLVIGALVVALWTSDGTYRYVIGTVDQLGGEPDLPFPYPTGLVPKRLTKDQEFLLEGDTSRETHHERQRAIWEAHPENRVYLGSYISALASGPGQESEQLDFCRKELAAARMVEPDNSRFDYLEAAWLSKAAAEVRSETVGKDETGQKKTEYSLEVLDRNRLDQAMAILRRGLEKPYMRRYASDMLDERSDILGPPRRFVDLVQRTAIAAAVLLPDLAHHRALSRVSRLYANLLISEGKTEEATPFLNAWRTLTVQLAEDSFTLIDILVVGAVAKDAETSVPPLYRQIGKDAETEWTIVNAETISKPVSEWRERLAQTREEGPQDPEQQRNERIRQERAGVLVSMLLPALGQWPNALEYEPERMLEYTVVTEFLLSVVSTVFLVGMAVCLIVALRWRFLGPHDVPPPPLLLPDVRSSAKIIVVGVLLPVVIFFFVTRYVPASGHHYSVKVGLHKLVAEFGLLLLALSTLPIIMTCAHVKQRCEALDIAAIGWRVRFLAWPLGLGAVLLFGVWCLPPTQGDQVKVFAGTAAALIGVCLGAGVLLGFVQGLVGKQQYGRFYGATFRTLIPLFALAVIVLGVSTKPFLLHAEARYLARDTLISDTDRAGFTRIENDLVERLRREILDGIEKL